MLIFSQGRVQAKFEDQCLKQLWQHFTLYARHKVIHLRANNKIYFYAKGTQRNKSGNIINPKRVQTQSQFTRWQHVEPVSSDPSTIKQKQKTSKIRAKYYNNTLQTASSAYIKWNDKIFLAVPQLLKFKKLHFTKENFC